MIFCSSSGDISQPAPQRREPFKIPTTTVAWITTEATLEFHNSNRVDEEIWITRVMRGKMQRHWPRLRSAVKFFKMDAFLKIQSNPTNNQ